MQSKRKVNPKLIHSVVHEFPDSYECDRCRVKIGLSSYNDCRVAYSTNSRLKSGFLCVRCTLAKNHRGIRKSVSEKDFEKYIRIHRLKPQPITTT